MNYLPLSPPPQHTTPLWKKILAGLSIFFGAMTFLGMFTTASSREAVGAFLLSLAFIIPGAWFFLHERKAKQAAPMQRHWGKVTAAIVGLLAVSGCISPQTAETEVSKFSSKLTSSSNPTTTTPTETIDIAVEHVEPEIQEEPEAQEEVMHNFVNVPEPTPEPAPEPVYVPEPAPVQSAYYGSCAEARAAGAAPLYAGSPGYSRKLDRDGDGVACE